MKVKFVASLKSLVFRSLGALAQQTARPPANQQKNLWPLAKRLTAALKSAYLALCEEQELMVGGKNQIFAMINVFDAESCSIFSICVPLFISLKFHGVNKIIFLKYLWLCFEFSSPSPTFSAQSSSYLLCWVNFDLTLQENCCKIRWTYPRSCFRLWF